MISSEEDDAGDHKYSQFPTFLTNLPGQIIQTKPSFLSDRWWQSKENVDQKMLMSPASSACHSLRTETSR